MSKETTLADVVKRLDILISLAAEGVGNPEMMKPSAKIRRLVDLGLSPVEIAAVMARGTNYVGAVLYQRPGKSAKKEKVAS